MDREMRRILSDRRCDGVRGYSRGRRSGYSRAGRSGGRDRDMRDMEYDGDIDRLDYDEDYDMQDGRRGVKGTGPYGIGGRRHYPRRDRTSYDMDGAYDGGNDALRLSKRDMSEWKRSLENDDGTHGPHFDIQQIEQAAEALGIRPRDYDLSALCMVANMYYSHLGELNRQFLPKEKETMYYTKAAKKWLDDPDAAIHGDEKLAAYYYVIVCDDE